MVTVRDVPAEKLIAHVKEDLKKVKGMQPPEWSNFVKTGISRERLPSQEDFWYIRAASVLRRVYLDGPIGVQKLRSYYGGRQRRGTKPARFKKAGGSILRKVLQQLEASELVEKVVDEKSKKVGRVVTAKGRKFLDNAAYALSKKPAAS